MLAKCFGEAKCYSPPERGCEEIDCSCALECRQGGFGEGWGAPGLAAQLESKHQQRIRLLAALIALQELVLFRRDRRVRPEKLVLRVLPMVPRQGTMRDTQLDGGGNSSWRPDVLLRTASASLAATSSVPACTVRSSSVQPKLSTASSSISSKGNCRRSRWLKRSVSACRRYCVITGRPFKT